ncbi:CpaF family protein [Ancylobacter sp. FA202]|uniref:CpaF family protein n=1 Tax=Ancylobacter sp. FA202 TaxID=1111106 RepID=UPI00039D91BC|nr:CpaF family protein [Ancylobacter sp. FA202]
MHKPELIQLAPVSTIRAEDRERLDAVRNRTADTLFKAADTFGPADPAALNSDAFRAEVNNAIRQTLQSDPQAGFLKAADREWLINDLTAEMCGFGPLEPLLARDDISEIMVNGTGDIHLEIAGAMVQSDIRFRSEDALQRIAKRMVEETGRRVDTSSPICDARLKDGSRINVTLPPIAVDGTILTIRKFRKERLTLEQLVAAGSLSPETMDVIAVIGRCRLNILISGGTGSGKTTLLNCVSSCVDERERIVTCEDTAELQLQKPHVVRMETRAANAEGTGEVTMRQLVRNALRQRPHRIIVGEVRGEEAVDLIQAMNTGHSGSMGTVHANDPRLALSRMEALVRTAPGYQSVPSLNIKRDLADSLDVIIQTEQLIDGKRVVTHVTDVLRVEGETITTEDLIVYDHARGRHVGKGQLRPSFYRVAERYGLAERLASALSTLNMTAREP